MLWRLLTGRLTRASLLTFLIIIGLRGCYLYARQQNATGQPLTVSALFTTPQPTFAKVSSFTTRRPVFPVSTPDAPMAQDDYLGKMWDVLEAHRSEMSTLFDLTEEVEGMGEMSPELYNVQAQRIGEQVNKVAALAAEVRLLHPPSIFSQYHQDVVDALDVVDQTISTMVLYYDAPDLVIEEDEDAAAERFAQAVEVLYQSPRTNQK